jgi:hypothetical protein
VIGSPKSVARLRLPLLIISFMESIEQIRKGLSSKLLTPCASWAPPLPQARVARCCSDARFNFNNHHREIHFSDIKHRKIKWLPIEIRMGLDARPARGAAAVSF